MFRASLVTLCITFAATAAFAQHTHEGDVEVEALSTGLYVPPVEHMHDGETEFFFVYEGEFGGGLNPPNVIDEPGITGHEGFGEGDTLGFNVKQSLLYWDGAQIAPAPADHSVEILGPTGNPALGQVIVDDSSGEQPGFTVGEAEFEADENLWEIHTHPIFSLLGPAGFDPAGLTPGAYGIWLELTSNNHATSNEFVILLNYGLTEGQFEAGVEAIGEIVPEPSSALLLCAAAVLAFRRR